jgi:hypothetical protein
MTQQEELKIRLEQHKMWLLDNSQGARFVAKNGENLSFANLTRADLSWADLSWANLSFANLTRANLSWADLSRANLTRANLTRANLTRANLTRANLSWADLSRANLSFANLSGADLSVADGFKFTPLQVVNTKYFITILDDYILWGCKKMTFDEVKKFEFKDCKDKNWKPDEFKLNKKIITEMIRYYRASN